MLKNNIEVDVKVKCIESDMTQAQLAEKIRRIPLWTVMEKFLYISLMMD